MALAAAPVPAERADLVIVNAHVWTVDDSRPEAAAVAVRGERIVLVGTSDEARRLAGPATRVVDSPDVGVDDDEVGPLGRVRRRGHGHQGTEKDG